MGIFMLNLLEVYDKVRIAETKIPTFKMARKLQTFCQSRTSLSAMMLSTTAYVGLLCYMKTCENPVLRMAAAGSLLTNIMEVGFYPLDTINTQSKICESKVSLRHQIR